MEKQLTYLLWCSQQHLHSSTGSAAAGPSDPKLVMHSVGRYLKSPLLFQNLDRSFSTNLASAEVLKIDPLSSVPSKSHTTDILIFWKVCGCILDYQFSAVCSCQGKGQMCGQGWGALPSATAIGSIPPLTASLTFALRCLSLCSGHDLVGRKPKALTYTSKTLLHALVENWHGFCVLAIAVNYTAPPCSYPLGSK